MLSCFFIQFSRFRRDLFDLLVGSSGLEPPTSRLSGVRSNHLSYEPMLWPNYGVLASRPTFGGDEQNRTVDPLLARQVLSQLSYTPVLRYAAKLLLHLFFCESPSFEGLQN